MQKIWPGSSLLGLTLENPVSGVTVRCWHSTSGFQSVFSDEPVKSVWSREERTVVNTVGAVCAPCRAASSRSCSCSGPRSGLCSCSPPPPRERSSPVQVGRHLPDNYRQIALLDAVGTIFAHSILENLTDWVVEEKILPIEQAGFRKNHSTLDNICFLKLIEEKYTVFRRIKIYVAFIDFSTAFDKVDRPLLWKKLHKMGVPCTCCL